MEPVRQGAPAPAARPPRVARPDARAHWTTQDWQPDRDWVRKMADNLGDEWQVPRACLSCSA
jgi:hypothetical protein